MTGVPIGPDHELRACLNSAIKCTWSMLKDVGAADSAAVTEPRSDD